MKNLAWVASVTALTLSLAACGQQSHSSTAAAQAPEAAAPLPTSQLPRDPYAQLGGLEPQATDPYNITLNFVPGSDSRVVTAMQQAATRWQGVVTQGLSAVTVNIPAGACGSNAAYKGTVDDVLIFTGSTSIDGPGGVLAQSGPCSVRSNNGLTTYATLIFDSADIAGFSTQLASIATHELGHSLGIGTLWQNKGLVTGIGGSDPRNIGANANREYRSIGGTIASIPVENKGGAGTAGGHWRETTFGNELMTGYLNTGSNPLSRMTIGTLQDLGYAVNYSVADAYSASTINTLSKEGAIDLEGKEQLITPKYQVQ